jgi:His/Glu/Gln/Arg/opine family amino acid ABC transporter permease subunit
MYEFKWDVIIPHLGFLAQGLIMTFRLSIAAQVVAIGAGLLAALVRMTRQRAVSWLGRLYIDFFRGTPLLVTLIWIYFGVSLVLGLELTAFAAGVLGLGLDAGAYLAEVFRAGLQAVPKGQREAALTLGLSRFQIMSRIVLPQAIRIIIPPLGNSYVGMLKNATLLSVIGLAELTRSAQMVAATTYRPFEVYTFVALVYVVITMAFSTGLSLVERKMRIRE